MNLDKRLLALLTLAIASHSALADIVMLRVAARLPEQGPVLLEHVASLTGPHAEALGSLVVVEPEDRPVLSVSIDDIRRVLANGGANMALIRLTGRRCELLTPTLRPDPEPGDLSLGTPVHSRTLADPEPEFETNPEPAPNTIGSAVLERLRELHRLENAQDLRVKFYDRDEALLSTPARGRLVEVRRTGMTSRSPLRLTVYNGEQVEIDTTVRAEVQVRREVFTLTQPRRRGATIEPGMVEPEIRWLEADNIPATYDQIVGAEASLPLEASTALMDRHVKAPVVVRRGELIVVHYLNGPVVLRTNARATQDARIGDRVAFETIGTRQRLIARVDAPGRAVVMQSPDSSPTPTHSPTPTTTSPTTTPAFSAIPTDTDG